jgi:hypothetical protein
VHFIDGGHGKVALMGMHTLHGCLAGFGMVFSMTCGSCIDGVSDLYST